MICSLRVVVICPLATPHPNTAPCRSRRRPSSPTAFSPGTEAARGRVADEQDAQPAGRTRRYRAVPSRCASATASRVSLGRGVPQNSGSPNDQGYRLGVGRDEHGRRGRGRTGDVAGGSGEPVVGDSRSRRSGWETEIARRAPRLRRGSSARATRRSWRRARSRTWPRAPGSRARARRSPRTRRPRLRTSPGCHGRAGRRRSRIGSSTR